MVSVIEPSVYSCTTSTGKSGRSTTFSPLTMIWSRSSSLRDDLRLNSAGAIPAYLHRNSLRVVGAEQHHGRQASKLHSICRDDAAVRQAEVTTPIRLHPHLRLGRREGPWQGSFSVDEIPALTTTVIAPMFNFVQYQDQHLTIQPTGSFPVDAPNARELIYIPLSQPSAVIEGHRFQIQIVFPDNEIIQELYAIELGLTDLEPPDEMPQ